MMHGHTMHADKPGFHGMLLVGRAATYLYHLPMFMSPHNYQAIFEVTLTATGSDPTAEYLADREKTGTKMYSFVPQQNFVLTDLILPSQDNPRLTSFGGSIFRGHFEDGHFEAKGLEIIKGVLAHVTRVIHFQRLDQVAIALSQLEYLMFGKALEIFLAHSITRPPDFDQVVGVQVTDHQFTDQDLAAAIPARFPGRPNSADQKVQANERFQGQAQLAGASPTPSSGITFQAGTEFYFETNDLAGSM